MWTFRPRCRGKDITALRDNSNSITVYFHFCKGKIEKSRRISLKNTPGHLSHRNFTIFHRSGIILHCLFRSQDNFCLKQISVDTEAESSSLKLRQTAGDIKPQSAAFRGSRTVASYEPLHEFVCSDVETLSGNIFHWRCSLCPGSALYPRHLLYHSPCHISENPADPYYFPPYSGAGVFCRNIFSGRFHRKYPRDFHRCKRTLPSGCSLKNLP